MAETPEQQLAPGVTYYGPHRVRRVLKAGDPRGDDYRDALAWVKDIRSRLAHIRGELHDIGRVEAVSEHDRICEDVAGAITLTLVALHRLVEGERSFGRRADRLDALWAEVEADPDGFVIEEGVDTGKARSEARTAVGVEAVGHLRARREEGHFMTDQKNALTCNCAVIPPTMPTCRGEHLRSCPLFVHGVILQMQANNEAQRQRNVCREPRWFNGVQLPDVEAAVLGAEAITLTALRAVIEGGPA